MNKTKTILALALLGAFASGASAQTAVNITGVMDLGVLHESGSNKAGSTTSLASGTYYGSRLTFRGVEDLGDGLAAVFWLENGLLADTGASDQGGLLFGRQAWVGLQGKFGAVRMGRQYVPIHLVNIATDPFEYAGVGGYLGVVGLAGNGGSRANNSIKYIAPVLGGFKAEALYGLGEAAGDAAQGRQIGGSITYANGPLNVSLVHHNSHNGTAAVPVANINSTKNTALSGTYDFRVAKLAAIYQQNKDDLVLNSRDWLIGVSVPFGAGAILASYIRQNNKTLANADTNRVSLGYTYAVSKRTSFYGFASRTGNDSNARVGLATIADGGSASGSTVRSFVVGIRHFF